VVCIITDENQLYILMLKRLEMPELIKAVSDLPVDRHLLGVEFSVDICVGYLLEILIEVLWKVKRRLLE